MHSCGSQFCTVCHACCLHKVHVLAFEPYCEYQLQTVSSPSGRCASNASGAAHRLDTSIHTGIGHGQLRAYHIYHDQKLDSKTMDTCYTT
jgi:hypothetical protein